MEHHAFSDSQEGLSWKDIAWLMRLACNFPRQPWSMTESSTCRLSDIVGTSVLTLNGVAVRALAFAGKRSHVAVIFQFHPDLLSYDQNCKPLWLPCLCPHTEAKLGWVLTIAFIAGLFPVALYSSLLMSRLEHVQAVVMSYSGVHMYSACEPIANQFENGQCACRGHVVY